MIAVLGALLVFAGLAVGAGEPWSEPTQVSILLCAASVIAVVTITALRRRRAGRRGLAAVEPVLAAFPLGLAAAAGGLDAAGGEAGISAVVIAAGSVCLVASVLWRRPQGARPGWTVVGVVVAGCAGLFVATGLKWWSDQLAPDLLSWPLSAGIGLASLVGVVSVTLGRGRGGGAWAVLVAAAGGMAFLAALAVTEYATSASGADADTDSGPWIAIFAGLVVASAGVYARLRP